MNEYRFRLPVNEVDSPKVTTVLENIEKLFASLELDTYEEKVFLNGKEVMACLKYPESHQRQVEQYLKALKVQPMAEEEITV
jgi:hypothetical protein